MRALPLLLCVSLSLSAHEGGRRNLKPTKAEADLRQARKRLESAKKKVEAQGRYACCVKPSCDLCLRTKGSCACAANVKRGLGGCGECLAGWRTGRGSVPGVVADQVNLLPAENQAMPGTGELPVELRGGLEALLRGKKTLVAEKRFLCCIGGGCGQCAMEAECPCGGDLATAAAPVRLGEKKQKSEGVCGDCYDGWHSGKGLFAGLPLSEVKLSLLQSGNAGMTTGSLDYSGYYLSGTAQTPAAQPFRMLHRRVKDWNLMLLGTLWGLHTNQTGERGRDKLFGAGWVMPMASRRVAGGIFTARTMFSVDPLLLTKGRYPMLFQTGETWKNIPIINGQHPHDFVMELAGSYQYPIGESTTLNLYAGLRGDPALGPTAYPHRVSASENPIAVISHHYQDSTHISSNVATLGVTHKWVTLEASGFHGREPDEKRWGVELGAIDSFASRLTVTPTARWSAQYSAGRINNREATHPDRDTFRQTASIAYVRPSARGHWATSVIWGRNHDLPYTQKPNSNLLDILRPNAAAKPGARREHIVLVPTRVRGQKFNAYTLESTLRFRDRNWVFGRAELSDKDSLLLFEEAPFVRLLEEYRYTRIKAYSAGYSRDLKPMWGILQPAIGGQWQLFQAPPNLAPIYGARPQGVQVWLRLRLAQTMN
jgi:hypothetical protein